jgi:hypothetical protein
MSLIDELLSMAARLEEIASKLDGKEVGNPVDDLEKASLKIGKAASGSFLGYHADVYYKDLLPPPPGAHFSVEWGLQSNYAVEGSNGEWGIWDRDVVRAEILNRASLNEGDLDQLRAKAKYVRKEIEETRLGVLSILSRLSESNAADFFLTECIDRVKKLMPLAANQIAKAFFPRGSRMSRDSLAVTAGDTLPPHLEVFAEILEVKNTYTRAGELATVARSLAAHFGRASLPGPPDPQKKGKRGDEGKSGHSINIFGAVHGGLQLDSPNASQSNATSSGEIEASILALKRTVLSSSLTELEKEEALLALDRILELSKRPRTPETSAAINGKVKDVKGIAAKAGAKALDVLDKGLEVFAIFGR